MVGLSLLPSPQTLPTSMLSVKLLHLDSFRVSCGQGQDCVVRMPTSVTPDRTIRTYITSTSGSVCSLGSKVSSGFRAITGLIEGQDVVFNLGRSPSPSTVPRGLLEMCVGSTSLGILELRGPMELHPVSCLLKDVACVIGPVIGAGLRNTDRLAFTSTGCPPTNLDQGTYALGPKNTVQIVPSDLILGVQDLTWDICYCAGITSLKGKPRCSSAEDFTVHLSTLTVLGGGSMTVNGPCVAGISCNISLNLARFSPGDMIGLIDADQTCGQNKLTFKFNVSTEETVRVLTNHGSGFKVCYCSALHSPEACSSNTVGDINFIFEIGTLEVEGPNTITIPKVVLGQTALVTLSGVSTAPESNLVASTKSNSVHISKLSDTKYTITASLGGEYTLQWKADNSASPVTLGNLEVSGPVMLNHYASCYVGWKCKIGPLKIHDPQQGDYVHLSVDCNSEVVNNYAVTGRLKLLYVF